MRRPSQVKAAVTAEVLKLPDLLAAFVQLQERHATHEEQRSVHAGTGAVPRPLCPIYSPLLWQAQAGLPGSAVPLD